MPCYDKLITYTTYPKGCSTSTPSPLTLPIRSEDVYYSGPNVPNSGTNTEDTVTVAIQKLDNKLAPSEIVAAVIAAIQADDDLRAALCAALNC